MTFTLVIRAVLVEKRLVENVSMVSALWWLPPGKCSDMAYSFIDALAQNKIAVGWLPDKLSIVLKKVSK